MNKFQKVKFNTIEDFLYFLPDGERIIVEYLRDLVFNTLQNPLEKLSYNVPYYYLNSRVCFIWPSSIPWGNVEKNGVLLGFCNGYLINDDINWLEKGNRKQMYCKTFTNVRGIERDFVKYYLSEAVKIDSKIKKK